MINYSVILPVFNEEKVIGNCLASLAKQTVAKEMEVIVVDDGSSDSSSKYATYKQDHQGPGAARNFGASHAKGEILVFVDADMEFAPDFVEKLVAPIHASKTIGTFSKEEYLLNKDNVWARLWNRNLGRLDEKMLSESYPETAPVFRAILKKSFEEAGGFETNVGYTDDWTISRKLGLQARAAPGAKFYHRNPDSLSEVWIQARWFGKNEFLTGNIIRKLYNLARYCPLLSIFRLYNLHYFIFTFIYNCAVFTSVLLSFFGEKKNK